MADDPTPEVTLADRIEANPEWKKDITARKAAAKKATDETTRADTAEARLAEIQGEQKAEGEAAEKKKLEDAGKYNEALTNQQTSMQGQIDAAMQNSEYFRGRVIDMVGIQSLIKALGAVGVPSDRLTQAAQLLGTRVKVEFDADGKESVIVLDEEGKPMFAEGGNPATLDDLATSFTAENAHFMPPSGDSGSGLHTGGSSPLAWEDIKDSPQKQGEYIEKHGSVAYMTLAGQHKPKDE